MEAKVAMDIAQVDGTLEFTLGTTANQISIVDLNKEPFKIKEEHLARIKALSRTGIAELIIKISSTLSIGFVCPY